jgi:hypothetical protein
VTSLKRLTSSIQQFTLSIAGLTRVPAVHQCDAYEFFQKRRLCGT